MAALLLGENAGAEPAVPTASLGVVMDRRRERRCLERPSMRPGRRAVGLDAVETDRQEPAQLLSPLKARLWSGVDT